MTPGNFVSIYKKAVGGACELCKIVMYLNTCVTSAFKVRYWLLCTSNCCINMRCIHDTFDIHCEKNVNKISRNKVSM